MHASTSSQILDSALDAIGNTPLVRLDRLAQEEGLKCNLLGKVEFLSAGGSVKDRIAKAMVLAAEKDGKLIPGKSVVIEPTSGNTGIGLAMTCAIKGYPVIITMPNKMSQEKEALLRALGAEVIRTPDEEPWDSPRSHIGVAKRLQREIPYGVILDQYGNVNNPLAHEYTTGPEIISAITSTVSTPTKPSSLKVDAFVAGAGTGGTITGVSRALKKDHNPQCIVVGVDPIGSVLALPEYLNDESPKPYVVEGIGYDFVPQVLSRDPSDVDHWVKSSDNDAFRAVQRLMVTEGLLVGGSSGSALSGALAWLKTERGQKVAQAEGSNVVVLLPDGIRNYMSKEWFLDFALRPGASRIPQTASDTVNRCN
ncbi:pyridoxal phosphate-dependent enzyme beta subunit [Pisolithus croceorrhizus]|nr:pyridoxal phosphate-dependent enzyme beta subunit [Pisolithus croceorrhizus]